jgi:hypothetical protein
MMMVVVMMMMMINLPTTVCRPGKGAADFGRGDRAPQGGGCRDEGKGEPMMMMMIIIIVIVIVVVVIIIIIIIILLLIIIITIITIALNPTGFLVVGL